jgi:superfamily II DNA or RNA helicase
MWTIKKCTYIDLFSLKKEEKEEKGKIKKIEKDLTITLKKSIGNKQFPPEIIKLFTYIGKYLVVPRFYPIVHNLPYKNTLFPKSKIDISFSFELITKNQEIVFEKLKQVYSEPNGCNLIMRTGEGKTFLGMKLIEFLKCKTLIVTHSREIAMTWEKYMNSFYSFLPCKNESEKEKQGKNEKIGTMFTNNKNKRDITVGVINTLLKQPKEWFDFDFIIYDEVTEYVSDKRRIIFELASAPYLLGLTATPDILKQNVFKYHIGPFLYAKNINGYSQQEIDWKVSIKAIKYYGPPEFTERKLSSIGFTSACEMDKQFMEDPYRNKLICNEIMKLYNLGKNVYVFFSLCAYGEIIKKLLSSSFLQGKNESEKEKSKNEIIDFLMGSYKTSDMEELKKNKRSIILTTYKYCSKGISIDKMDAIILCQPRKADTEQTIGRILRASGNVESERIIVDIVDMCTTLKSQFSHRKKIYKEFNFDLQFEKIHYDSI